MIDLVNRYFETDRTRDKCVIPSNFMPKSVVASDDSLTEAKKRLSIGGPYKH